MKNYIDKKQLIISAILCFMMVAFVGLNAYAYKRSIANATLTTDKYMVASDWKGVPDDNYANGLYCNTSNMSAYAIAYMAYGKNSSNGAQTLEASKSQGIGSSSTVAFSSNNSNFILQRVYLFGYKESTMKKGCIGTGIICVR